MIEAVKSRWDDFNRVDHYGLNEPAAIVGIGILAVVKALDNPVGRRLVDAAVGLVMDSTDYLDPRVSDFDSNRWREIQFGPISGSAIVPETRVPQIIEEHMDHRGPVFKMRQAIRDLTRRRR